MGLIFITYIMLLGLAVGWVRIFYVCFKKIRLGVGKSKSRSLDANKKTEGLMYSNAGGEVGREFVCRTKRRVGGLTTHAVLSGDQIDEISLTQPSLIASMLKEALSLMQSHL